MTAQHHQPLCQVRRGTPGELLGQAKTGIVQLYVAEQVVTDADLLADYFQLVGDIADPQEPEFKWATAQLILRVQRQQQPRNR